MLAHFKLQDSIIASHNATIKEHWPDAIPNHATNTHVLTHGFSPVLCWSLARATVPGSSYASLLVEMTPLTFTLQREGFAAIAPNDIRLRYHEGFHAGLVTVAERESNFTHPLGFADLHLAHEFAKRIVEIKILLDVQRRAAA